MSTPQWIIDIFGREPTKRDLNQLLEAIEQVAEEEGCNLTEADDKASE